MRKILFLLIMGVSFSIVNAQESCMVNQKPKELTSFDQWFMNGWGTNMGVGATVFFGDISTVDFSEVSPVYYIGLQKELTSYLSWRFNTSFGRLEGSKDFYYDGKTANSTFKGKFTEVNTTLKLNLFDLSQNLRDSKLSPYIYAGVGLLSFRAKQLNSKTGSLIYSIGYNQEGTAISSTKEVEIPLGLGLEFNVNKSLSFTLDGSMTLVNTDKLDACLSNDEDNIVKKDMFGTISLGFVYKFGNRDCDKDGVVNRMDKCPETPYGIEVNVDGCPLDKDGDGVPDFEDKCPKEAGLAEFGGCPDTDGDGIADPEDKCPKEAGLAEFGGCPDTDGDGIADPEDKCPKEAGLAKFGGCPDTDGDGIADPEDKCPNQAGLTKFGGCPDTDKDGIPDNEDKCPKVAGIKANSGCPAIKKEVLRIFEKALTGIQFESGKDVILKSSYYILDQVVKVMNENPEYNLEINGHTDNVGDSAKNRVLSEKRAEAVRKYMINKGILDTRMIARGFGDTMPIADNSTKVGKSKNRRVEFKVLFQKIEFIEQQ